MRKKYIVMIGPSITSKGGIASVLSNYKKAGFFNQFNVKYLSTHIEGNKISKLWLALSMWCYLCWLLITGQVLLLHAHVARWNSFWRKSVFLVLMLVFRRPYIVHIHSGGFEDFYSQDCNKLQRKIIKWILEQSGMIVVLTQKAYDWVGTVVLHDRVIVVPNFVPDDKILEKNYQKQKGSILFLGRFNEEKGIFDLLDAMSIVSNNIPEVKLVLCGDGDIVGVKNKIDKLGLSVHVELLGWVSGKEKKRVLYESQIFVLPSYVEGLPIGVLEAMQCGCPVVATTVGGIPDQVQNEVQGILVEPGNVVALATALERLLSNSELCEQMGQHGIITIREKFSYEVVMPKIEKIYRDLGYESKF